MKRDEAITILLIIIIVVGGLGGMTWVINKVFTDCVNSIPPITDQGVFND
jgi:uncharacterized protein YneF (UPF0154 family)